MIRDMHVNTIAADVLPPCVARSSAVMILYDTRDLLLMQICVRTSMVLHYFQNRFYCNIYITERYMLFLYISYMMLRWIFIVSSALYNLCETYIKSFVSPCTSFNFVSVFLDLIACTLTLMLMHVIYSFIYRFIDTFIPWLHLSSCPMILLDVFSAIIMCLLLSAIIVPMHSKWELLFTLFNFYYKMTDFK